MRLHPKTERLIEAAGRDISTWRTLQGLTATAVADRAGITRTTLRTIERNPASASFGTVMAVLAVLGLDESVAQALDPTQSERGQALLTARARGEVR